MKKTIVIIAVTACVSCLITNTIRDVQLAKSYDGVERKIESVLNIVDKVSVYDVDGESMGNAAAKAIVRSLGDVYSGYYSKKDYELLKSELMNVYIGIGVTVTPDRVAEKVKIQKVAAGKIAWEKGLQIGDYIVAVDGTRYSDKEMQELVANVRGESGTNVTLTIEREGIEFDVTIERKPIEVETVSSRLMEDDIGYIRISRFNNDNKEVEGSKDTFEMFKEQLESLKELKIGSLIIDLRDNPGGTLEVVTKIADYLLPSGVITYTEDKKGEREYFNSDENFVDMPMVVLINENSASASEVLSGALRDYKKATLVGKKTFGKGVVQSVVPVYDGSAVVITSSKYFTPSGECIHEKGIEPDIEVSLSVKKEISELTYQEDSQLQKAVEILMNN